MGTLSVGAAEEAEDASVEVGAGSEPGVDSTLVLCSVVLGTGSSVEDGPAVVVGTVGSGSVLHRIWTAELKVEISSKEHSFLGVSKSV